MASAEVCQQGTFLHQRPPQNQGSRCRCEGTGNVTQTRGAEATGQGGSTEWNARGQRKRGATVGGKLKHTGLGAFVWRLLVVRLVLKALGVVNSHVFSHSSLKRVPPAGCRLVQLGGFPPNDTPLKGLSGCMLQKYVSPVVAACACSVNVWQGGLSRHHGLQSTSMAHAGRAGLPGPGVRAAVLCYVAKP